jgi:hypothetical protein
MEFIKTNVNLSRAQVTVADFGYPLTALWLTCFWRRILNLHPSQAQVTLAEFHNPF